MEKKIKRERNSTTKDEIVSLLKTKKVALTHKDFQDYFEKSIDRVTIYRALDRLVEEGKLHKIANLDGGIQYALCNTCEHKNQEHNHDHVHFNCVKCHETTCIENTSPKIILPKDYIIQEKQLLLIGICPNCN
ncbi:MAG: Fur family transcriptional regulator [Flavobacterium sp.]|mgnify:CR=1 FL=1|jgi:Fur family ferric uptake transcriptional regulator|uniref:Fur family transcriptional regulator n=1 Tax=Flavobacterium sp. TaxID=239 RepID=UPI0037BED6AA